MEISFGGCGFLGVYHIGVGKCFEDNARHLLKSFKGFYGASAGSICAAAAACRCDSMVAYKWVKKTVEASRVYRMGLLNPQFDLYTRLRTFLENYLPKDAHKRARGKVRISMTTFPDMKNYVVSDFTTRKELINVSRFRVNVTYNTLTRTYARALTHAHTLCNASTRRMVACLLLFASLTAYRIM